MAPSVALRHSSAVLIFRACTKILLCAGGGLYLLGEIVRRWCRGVFGRLAAMSGGYVKSAGSQKGVILTCITIVMLVIFFLGV